MDQLRTFLFKHLPVLFGVLLAGAPLSFAYASVSVSIQSLSPSTNISVGTNLSFSVAASGFTNPSYTVSDSLGGSSVGNGNINSSGNFSWTPNGGDVGTHTLSIAVNDSSGDSATTTEQIVVSAPVSVSIQSLSPSSSVTPGMTVSFSAVASGFSSPTYSVSDSFSGSSISNGNINSSGNFSWSPASNQTGTHTITIYVTDSSGHTASATETISVGAAPTLTIESLSPSSSITVGQTVTFYASASGFSNPTYSVSDSFSGSSISNGDINSSGYFSWTPTSNDAGTHTITVTSVDSSGHTATATQTITVGGSSSSVQGLSPGTNVIVGNPVTFTVAAAGFSNPVFSISDSFSGSSISNSRINSAGYFNWTPSTSDVGTHNLTIYINDSSGHSGNVTLSLNVQEPNITITSISPGTVVLPNSQLSFTVSPAGFTNPTYTLADSFGGTTITNANINSSGYFTWTPATSQDGTHTVTVYATDSYGHSANTQITVSVNSGVSVALTAPSPNSSVGAGTSVSFQTYAYGFTTPTYSVQDSFGGTSVTNADINSSGMFSWTPTNNDAGTHTITVTATDPYGHVASSQTTITVAGGSQTASVTTSSGTISFTENLSSGMTNAQVGELQATLKALGFFSGSVTGYFGAATKAAVEAFQGAHGIAQVGSVGPATRAELNALLTGSATNTVAATPASDGYVFNNFLGLGYSGTGVTELQKRLTALGDYTGPISGYFGSLTQAAVRAFQSAHGITQAGYVGPSTRAALNQ